MAKAKKKKRELPENAEGRVRFIVSSSKECQTLEEKACDFFESYNLATEGHANNSIYFEHSFNDSVKIHPIKDSISIVCYYTEYDGERGEIHHTTPGSLGMFLKGTYYEIKFKPEQ